MDENGRIECFTMASKFGTFPLLEHPLLHYSVHSKETGKQTHSVLCLRMRKTGTQLQFTIGSQASSPLKKSAAHHSLSKTRLEMAYYTYLDTQSITETKGPEEVQFIVRPPGRPMALTPEEEDLTIRVTDYFNKIGHLFTRPDIADLV